jgi:Domain of unknown function (DUF6883)
MKLPDPERAVIPREKIEAYLLSPVHPVGRHKAAFFGSLGYTQSGWQVLEGDIKGLAFGDIAGVEETDYGRKYEVPGTITGPNGRAAAIVTAWIVLSAENFPRFITAYPQD